MVDWVAAQVRAKRRWTERLFSLGLEVPGYDFKAGQFIRLALDIDGRRVIRPFSLVNAPHERPLEIYFNIVPEGPLSPRLAGLESGDQLWAADKPGGKFTMDNVVPRRHLWLLGTGTALGVYLSILKTDEPWQYFERVVLVHGVRSTDELTYRETIDALQQHHGERLRFIPALSREQQVGVLQGRITNLLESGALEESAGLEIHPSASHLMLCGNSGMIQDVRALLEARGLRRHRRSKPGHYTTEPYF